MNMTIEGEPSGHKRFRVMRDVEGLLPRTLASFDTLDEAVAHVGTLRRDRRYVIRDHGREIVWPKKRHTP